MKNIKIEYKKIDLIGILAMPNAFLNAGYAVGFAGTIIIGIICTYCIHMLLRSHYELCKRKKVFALYINLLKFNLTNVTRYC